MLAPPVAGVTSDQPVALAPLVQRLSARVDPERLRADVHALAFAPRSTRLDATSLNAARAYVRDALTAAGWAVEDSPFTVRWQLGVSDLEATTGLPPVPQPRRSGRGRTALARLPLRLHRLVTGRNLLARLPDARGPSVVVAAHLDTVVGSPGADDNASGVAALLEVARLLAAAHPRPSVTLAVLDAEELGLLGARVAARLLGAGGARGMIGLECVGCFSDDPGSQRLPRGSSLVFPTAHREIVDGGARGDFALVAYRRSSASAACLWRTAASRLPRPLPAVLVRDRRPDGPVGRWAGVLVPVVNQLGRSDHAAFWDERIPALMVTDTANFRNPRYHRAEDTPDTLDYVRLAGVAVATAAVAAAW